MSNTSDITNLLSVLENVELNEQQIEALDKFFQIHKEKVKKELMEDVQKSSSNIQEPIDLSEYVKRSDAEKAFELFEQDAERAFELFEKDTEKAFQAAMEDLKQQYTQQMATALHELYTDIEERVRNDFMESPLYQTLVKIKELVIPLLEEDNSELVEKFKTILEEKEKIQQENKELSRKNTINILMKDIPKEFYETVENFISKGKDEEEIIERFNTILEAIEIKEFGKKERQATMEKAKQNLKKQRFTKKSIKQTNTLESKEYKHNKITKPIVEGKNNTHDIDHVFEYETLKKELESKEKLQPFTEEEYQLLQKVVW